MKAESFIYMDMPRKRVIAYDINTDTKVPCIRKGMYIRVVEGELDRYAYVPHWRIPGTNFLVLAVEDNEPCKEVVCRHVEGGEFIARPEEIEGERNPNVLVCYLCGARWELKLPEITEKAISA